MANWSELQYDVLVHVAQRLNLIEDYLNFASVCKPWRRAATKNNFNSELHRAPWLMLAEVELKGNSSYREFFSLYNGMVLKKRVPKASGKLCMESKGWLITVGKDNGEISLLHPFSGVQIELPHRNDTDHYTFTRTPDMLNCVRRAVLTASPSQTSDYIMVISLFGERTHLCYWRPGDLRWTTIVDDPSEQHHDVVYFDGKFYAVDWEGQVLVYDFTGAEPIKARKVAQLPSRNTSHIGSGREYYIVESLGSLLVVVRRYSQIPLVPSSFEYDSEFPFNRQDQLFSSLQY